MSTRVTVSVSVPVDYDRASAVLRSDVLCWLPAIAGRKAGWTTAVRRGLLHVRVEATVGPPWVTDRRRVARALALEPRAGGSEATGSWEPGSWLARPASGELILDGSDGDVALRFEGQLTSRRPLARRVTVTAIRQLLHDIATRMPSAPTTTEDDAGGRAVSVVPCPVVRPR